MLFNDGVADLSCKFKKVTSMGPIESDKVIIFFNIYNYYKNILEESKVIVRMDST